VTIVVVGAGVVGCSIAYELASRGARVRVLDGRGAGLGATRASAGMLAPYTEGHIPALRTLGIHSLDRYDRFIERVRADSGHEIEYERTGSLHVAVGPEEHAQLCATAAALRKEGVAHALLDAKEARALEPEVRPDLAGAIHIRDHGYIAAGALTRALADAASRRGAAFQIARVLSIAGDRAPRVETEAGGIDADAVIVSAGSWSGLFAAAAVAPSTSGDPRPAALSGRNGGSGQPMLAVKPIRGQLVHLRLGARPAARVVWGSGCYLVPWRDGTVLAGATVEDVGFDEAATVSGVLRLLDESTRLLPILRDGAFADVRVGLRPMTADELPAIGPSSTMRQVFYATGHYRNGVLLAPLTATLTADLVLEGRASPELSLVRPDRLGL
jgi:glycine oxidase